SMCAKLDVSTIRRKISSRCTSRRFNFNEYGPNLGPKSFCPPRSKVPDPKPYFTFTLASELAQSAKLAAEVLVQTIRRESQLVTTEPSAFASPPAELQFLLQSLLQFLITGPDVKHEQLNSPNWPSDPHSASRTIPRPDWIPRSALFIKQFPEASFVNFHKPKHTNGDW
ncbi:unnamed protein product, partial [Nesidiocoris tenuis]